MFDVISQLKGNAEQTREFELSQNRGAHQVQPVWCCEPSEYEIAQTPNLRKNLSGDGTEKVCVSEGLLRGPCTLDAEPWTLKLRP